MKWMLCFVLSFFVVFGSLMASKCEGDACLATPYKKTNAVEKQKDQPVINQLPKIEQSVKPFSNENKCGMPRCYSKNKKPATMEDENMRRAKVFHRGLPIEGCAPLGPEEHKKRFEAEKRKLEQQKKEAAKAQ
jgi:hypothetical protein